MAFSYTTDWTDRVGKFRVVGGTWNAASATTGTISFGPIVINSVTAVNVTAIKGANVVSSTSVTTMTAWKLVPAAAGTTGSQCTIALTCVSNDKGYWSAEYI